MLKIKNALIITTIGLLWSCSGNLEKNLEELDKIHGYCDNPQRQFSDRDYKICKAKERAQGDGMKIEDVNLTELFNRKNSVIYQNPVNPELWSASLDITENYSLKIADNQGGYIETDWIFDEKFKDKRCLIKIRITSAELVSTGVQSKLVCENMINNTWIRDQNNYFDEEKNLTLKILVEAQKKQNS